MTLLRRILYAFALIALSTGVLASPPVGPPPVEGKDFVRIDGGAPFAPVKGTVEIVEAFSYVCHHCASLEPLLAAWAKGLPKTARLVPLPVSFGGPTDVFARAYFAARALKVPVGFPPSSVADGHSKA